jgi:hypothetical protein
MFCAPGLIFGGTEGVRSRFHVLCSRTCIQHYRGCRLPFTCITCPDSFSAVPRASGPVFKFCASGLISNGNEGVGSRFHVLRARTHFRRIRGCRITFSCFALTKSFPTISRASSPVFKFCAPGLVFGGTAGIGSRFHFLRSRTRFDRAASIGSCFHVLRASTRFQRYRGRRLRFSCFALPDSFSAVVRSRFQVLRARTSFRWYRGRQVPFSFFAFPESFSVVPRVLSPVFMFCSPGVISRGTEGVESRFHVLCSRTSF